MGSARSGRCSRISCMRGSSGEVGRDRGLYQRRTDQEIRPVVIDDPSTHPPYDAILLLARSAPRRAVAGGAEPLLGKIDIADIASQFTRQWHEQHPARARRRWLWDRSGKR